ncbi:MAG: anhydro-N-acetylmuramic acid kinase, partial [Gammaproteobacteria bacterium]|nr:anhydro-N-acetylmuramic acid kinase [Gammaproteobacteria bacterium]
MAARSSGKPSHIYLGLMSGTSMDGVDAAAVEFSGEDYKVLGSSHLELPADLAKQLYQLCLPGKNEIEAMAEADIKVAKLFSKAVDKLLSKLNLSRNRVAAIGSHGQTIRHLPELGTTIQIGDPNVIAHETGILTVADFRRADMAAGGQGAPLVPAFHKKIFQDEAEHRVILNIGGIANITQLPSLQSNGTVIGYDTGPGNGLMNMWAQQQLNRAFDEGGRWAASGQNNSALFELCITDPYFDKTAPKSTGREYFNLDWLGLRLNRLSLAPSPEDV